MTPEQAEYWANAQEQVLANFNLAGAAFVIVGAILCFVGPGLRNVMFLKRRDAIQEQSFLQRGDQVLPETPQWEEAEILLRVEILEAKAEPTRKESFAERLGLGLLFLGALVVLLSSYFQWVRVGS
ncbi:hypothetical protein [Pseudarthrobacter sulfonivorans]|uniref:hypothetical protein n=1 Tax=Pseudarthrobacter sulfonivorans TaxID=121292 RepID=UPI002108395F|nr:hypothetical protein [Pseudarthrobacter sulfonivorans]